MHYIADNVVYNLISPAQYREATRGTVVMEEQPWEDPRKDTEMIYVTFVSYLLFIKSPSSHSDQVKIKALQRGAWGSASLEEEEWAP